MANNSYSINTTWYLDINRWARDSPWAHGAMATYSHDLGVGLLALCLLGAWWWSRRSPAPARAVAAVLWAAGGTVVAWGIAHYGLKPLVAERRPYLALAHVEVLLTRTHGYSFPSGHATVSGAVIVGLYLARRWLAAIAATVLGLLLCFGRVYTGMHYPFDVVGGLVFGGVVVAVLWPIAVPILTRFDQALLTTGLRRLVAVGGGSAGLPSGTAGTAGSGQSPGLAGTGTRVAEQPSPGAPAGLQSGFFDPTPKAPKTPTEPKEPTER